MSRALKLVGFSIWDRRTRPGRNVMFPSRSYTIGGERRQYALLRASEEALGIQTFLGKAATANDMRAGMHF